MPVYEALVINIEETQNMIPHVGSENFKEYYGDNYPIIIREKSEKLMKQFEEIMNSRL